MQNAATVNAVLQSVPPSHTPTPGAVWLLLQPQGSTPTAAVTGLALLVRQPRGSVVERVAAPRRAAVPIGARPCIIATAQVLRRGEGARGSMWASSLRWAARVFHPQSAGCLGMREGFFRLSFFSCVAWCFIRCYSSRAKQWEPFWRRSRAIAGVVVGARALPPFCDCALSAGPRGRRRRHDCPSSVARRACLAALATFFALPAESILCCSLLVCFVLSFAAARSLSPPVFPLFRLAALSLSPPSPPSLHAHTYTPLNRGRRVSSLASPCPQFLRSTWSLLVVWYYCSALYFLPHLVPQANLCWLIANKCR